MNMDERFMDVMFMGSWIREVRGFNEFWKRSFRPDNFVRASSAGEAPVQVFKTMQVFESC